MYSCVKRYLYIFCQKFRNSDILNEFLSNFYFECGKPMQPYAVSR